MSKKNARDFRIFFTGYNLTIDSILYIPSRMKFGDRWSERPMHNSEKLRIENHVNGRVS